MIILNAFCQSEGARRGQSTGDSSLCTQSRAVNHALLMAGQSRLHFSRLLLVHHLHHICKLTGLYINYRNNINYKKREKLHEQLHKYKEEIEVG